MMFDAGKGMPCINCARLACAVGAGAAGVSGAGAGVSARLHPTNINNTATSNPDSLFIYAISSDAGDPHAKPHCSSVRELNCADLRRVYITGFHKVKITKGLRAFAGPRLIDIIVKAALPSAARSLTRGTSVRSTTKRKDRMRRLLRVSAALAWVVLLPSAALAQATIAGVVRDASGAVLPGVVVEATSPALIEKVRTAVTDGTGQFRIIDLRPEIGRAHV